MSFAHPLDALTARRMTREANPKHMGSFLDGKRQSYPDSDAIEWDDKDAFNPTEIDKHETKFRRLRRNIGVAAKLHETALPYVRLNANTPMRHNVVMVTLTYRNADDWQPKHIASYITNVRNWLHRRTDGLHQLRYVWVAELQKRGAVHYHVLVWMPRGYTMPKADKQGWWKHGTTKTEQAVAPVKYIMKYASKLDSKGGEGFPAYCRMFGVGGLDQPGRWSRKWLNYPAFIKGRASINETWERVPGGGWLEAATGIIWPSEWGVSLLTRKAVHLLRLHSHERLIDADGPFNWLGEKPVVFQ